GVVRAERLRGTGALDELGGLADDPQRVLLRLLGGVAPGGDAVPAEDAADRGGVLALDSGDVQAQLEAGAAPRHPHHGIAEALAGQALAVGRGRERDPR